MSIANKCNCTNFTKNPLASFFMKNLFNSTSQHLLQRIFSETFMSITNKYNYKSFTKSPPASFFMKNLFNSTSPAI